MKFNKGVFITLVITMLVFIGIMTMGLSSHWKSVMLHGYNGTNWQPLKMDGITRASISATLWHHEVHDGHGFVTSMEATAATMGSGVTETLTFKTPTGTKRIHMVVDFITLTGGKVEVIEGCDWTAESGTTTVIFNRKRLASMTDSGILEDSGVSTFAATNSMSRTADSFGGGTVLLPVLHAFGAKNKFTGAARDAAEWVLKPDTKYGVRFTSAAASNSFQTILNWYEHTDDAT